LKGLAMENVGTFYGHLLYFVTIWYISWSFAIFSPVLVCYYQEKSGNPDFATRFNVQFVLRAVLTRRLGRHYKLRRIHYSRRQLWLGRNQFYMWISYIQSYNTYLRT
jgi:hypothetical protein